MKSILVLHIVGNYQSVASSNLEKFKYFILIEIQGLGGISPLRVSNIQVTLTFVIKSEICAFNIPETNNILKILMQ